MLQLDTTVVLEIYPDLYSGISCRFAYHSRVDLGLHYPNVFLVGILL